MSEELARPDAPPAAEGPPAQPAAPETASFWEDRLRRALADLDNMRKRFRRELADEQTRERERVAAEWLPVVDNLERAVAHATGSSNGLLAGVRAVRDQAVAILARLGFPRFEDVGRPFDAVRHEAVGTVEGDAPAGTVVAAVRPGYGTDDRILRPAGVMVARGAASPPGEGPSPD